MQSILALLRRPRIWGFIGHRPRWNPRPIFLLKYKQMNKQQQQTNNMTPFSSVTMFVSYLSAIIRGTSSSKWGTYTESHNQIICREWETLKHPILNGMHPSNFSLLAQRTWQKRRPKDCNSQWRWKTASILSSRYNRARKLCDLREMETAQQVQDR